MSTTLRIALVTVAALSAGSSGVLAQNNMRAMNNDTRIERSTAAERAARAARAQQFQTQQDRQVLPGAGDWNPDGTSPVVDGR